MIDEHVEDVTRLEGRDKRKCDIILLRFPVKSLLARQLKDKSTKRLVSVDGARRFCVGDSGTKNNVKPGIHRERQALEQRLEALDNQARQIEANVQQQMEL